jgi:Flp pilus assembly pilin Flp
MRLIQKLRGLKGDVRGLSTVEYTVLLVLIVAGSVGVWKSLGQNVINQLGKSQAAYQSNVTPLSPEQ